MPPPSPKAVEKKSQPLTWKELRLFTGRDPVEPTVIHLLGYIYIYIYIHKVLFFERVLYIHIYGGFAFVSLWGIYTRTVM